MNIDDAYQSIANAVTAGRNAHAYLVCGSQQDCSSFAGRLLLFLLCESASERPCGKCKACASVPGRSHPDITWLYPKGKGRVISVDDVRNTIKTLQQTSFGGSWKVCVVTDAESMNQSSANAFLKTLEEPGGKTVILLLSSKPEFLLPTIKSRCQMVSLLSGEQISPTEWNEKLYGLLADDAYRTRQSGKGAGSVLKALAISGSIAAIFADVKEWASDNAEKELKWIQDQMTRDAEESDDFDELLDAAATAKMKGIRSQLVKNLELWHRDILMLVLGAPAEVLYHVEHIEVLKERASLLSAKAALHNVEQIELLNRYFDRNLNNDEALRYVMPQLA